MRIKEIVLGLALAVAAPCHAYAQAPSSTASWETLRTLPPGEQVLVRLVDGKTTKGMLVSVADNRLDISRKNKTLEYKRGEIVEVHRLVGRDSSKKSALIGAGAGFAAGAAAAAAISEGADITMALTIPVFGGIGAGIGALIGFASGRRVEKVLIYKSNPPESRD